MSELPSEDLRVEWKDSNAPEVPVRGAIGGAHPDGTISILFYSERASLADTSLEENPHLIRTVHLAAVMSPLVARQIAKWLLERADEADIRSQEAEETT